VNSWQKENGMKTLNVSTLLLAVTTAAGVCAAQQRPTRVPPPGISIPETNRAELRAGADALAREIETTRQAIVARPGLLELLPDVRVFHKAVDWALRYDEFYRSNEVGLARALLKQGMERAKQLREGKPSWLSATGLVVRGYVSGIDGSVQPYGLVVPATFASDPRKARRLDVWLHGRDNNLTELKFISDRQRSYGEFTPPDAFVLHPYGRYCNAFKFAGEVDVFEAMEHAKRFYRIDDRRVALRGFSMGGAGVWHLAAHHSDVWAVAAPGAGFAESAEYLKLGTNKARIPSWEQKLWQLYDATDYAANFFTLPVVAYNGTDDPQRQAADVMERAMKAEGLTLPRVWGTNVGHKYTPEGKAEVSRFADEVVSRGKPASPSEVHFTTRTLRYNHGPGITIRRLTEHWKRADVTSKIAANGSLEVTTRNVEQFRIERPDNSAPSKNILIDGQRVAVFGGDGNATALSFFARDGEGRWTQVVGPAEDFSIAKKPGLQGPIDDAFMSSFLIVRPTGQPRNAEAAAWISSRLAKATNEWRAHFRGDARVKNDGDVTPDDIARHNLVLFGDPQSNKLLAKIADKLPIQWTAQSVRVGEKIFSAATHVPVFMFPNPLNPNRYVLLNSGFTFAEGTGSNAQQTPKLPDYAVLDIENGDVVVLADFFDEGWKVRGPL
jgi:hypothetical protein